MAEQWPDPFERGRGWVANLAARLRCTEGQLYSMAIGILVTWVVAANALPHVVWNVDDRVGTPARTGREESAASSGLLTAPFADSTLDFGTNAAFERGSGLDELSSSPEIPPPETPNGSTDAQLAPVHVVEGGYAANGAGTPLATFGVPEGSVAVSRRLGQPDKIVYLRLAGGGTPLELLIDSAGVNVNEPTASLRLCLVTETDWNVGRGNVSVADAPSYDCTNAISGGRAPSGDRWTFDVRALDLEQIPGVAILPGDGGPVEFQVVFRLAAPGGGAQP